MDIRQFLTLLLMARNRQQGPQPAMGRAGGVGAGMPLRPVAGVSTGSGSPLMQQSFTGGGPAMQPPAPVVNHDVGTQPGPLAPGGALYEAGRAQAMQAAQANPQAFATPPDVRALDTSGAFSRDFPGTPLPPEGMGGASAMPVENVGTSSEGMLGEMVAQPGMGGAPDAQAYVGGPGPVEVWENSGGPQSEPITDTYKSIPVSGWEHPAGSAPASEERMLRASREAQDKLVYELLRQRGLLR